MPRLAFLGAALCRRSLLSIGATIRSGDRLFQSTQVKTDNIEAAGVVTECLAQYKFRVALPCGHQCIAHLGGRLIKNYIRITTADEVVVELSPYDLTRGRIVRRLTK